MTQDARNSWSPNVGTWDAALGVMLEERFCADPRFTTGKKVVFGCYSVFFSAAMTHSDQRPLGEERVGLAYTSGHSYR